MLHEFSSFHNYTEKKNFEKYQMESMWQIIYFYTFKSDISDYIYSFLLEKNICTQLF